MSDEIRQRFEAKYEPEPNSGCWLWLGFCDPFGYGKFWWNGWGGRLAHRAAWVLFRGPIPAGMCVLHECDVPQCVNPRHLRLGTQLENVADRDRRGRGECRELRVFNASGTRNGHAKLTPVVVREIRRRYAAGETQRAIAATAGVNQGHVSAVVRRARWSSVE